MRVGVFGDEGSPKDGKGSGASLRGVVAIFNEDIVSGMKLVSRTLVKMLGRDLG